jgi:WD40 repeat protein
MIYIPDEQNNSYLISSSWDQTIRVWCLITGSCITCLAEHTSSVNSLVLMPLNFCCSMPKNDHTNCRHLASGSNDNTIKLWNLSTGKSELTLRGHTSLVKSILLVGTNRDDMWNRNCELVSSSNDKTIRIWNLNGGRGGRTVGQCLKVLRGHERGVNCMSMLLSHLLVSASSDNTIKVWDLNRGTCLNNKNNSNGNSSNDASKCVYTLNEHEDAVKCLVFF